LIRLLVEKKGTRSLTYQFHFYRLEKGRREQVARGRLTLVCAARQSDGRFKAVPLPRVLTEKLQEAPPGSLENGAPDHQSGSKARAGHSRPGARSTPTDLLKA
jgi:hypothetical protein